MRKSAEMQLIELRYPNSGKDIKDLLLMEIRDADGRQDKVAQKWDKNAATISRWIDGLGLRPQVNEIRLINGLPIEGDFTRSLILKQQHVSTTCLRHEERLDTLPLFVVISINGGMATLREGDGTIHEYELVEDVYKKGFTDVLDAMIAEAV